jgi:hypothetical protein
MGERIDRQSAARREIDTACQLFFSKGDALCIELLAHAASDMLRGVAIKLGKDTFGGRIEKNIKSEHLKDWRKALRAAYNFSKHADQDPDASLDDFNPEVCAWTLIGAVTTYMNVYGTRTVPMMLFLAWFGNRNPDVLLEPLKSQLLRLPGMPSDLPSRSFEHSIEPAAEIFRAMIENAFALSGILSVGGKSGVEYSEVVRI